MRVFLILSILLLSACIYFPGQYIEPDSQGLSTVANFSRGSGNFLSKPRETYIISKIDNKEALYLDKFFLDGYSSASWLMTSGRHRLIIKISFISDPRNKDQLPLVAYVPLEIEITPYSHYRLEGKVEGNTARVWLINLKDGAVASGSAHAVLKSQDSY